VVKEEFVVVPALDVLEGRCVRLAEGNRERVVVEGGDPAEAAERFARDGAVLLHLVDLDGAFRGRPTPKLVERVVAASAGVPVQVGGGLRTLEAAEAALEAGAARVVVGTAALEPTALATLAARLGDRLVVAIDARDGDVQANGWTRETGFGASELAARCAAAGVARLLVTSTRRDGTLGGPDTGLLNDVLDASGLPVLAAGGVASLDDLSRLAQLGCEGAVVGSALWLGRFSLADALSRGRAAPSRSPRSSASPARPAST
jgi:phosphoribosylformimino-5-aminoimidazole carboxamide ribotide isomerase